MLVQLGAGRGLEGVERILLGARLRGQVDVPGQSPSFPTLLPPGSARLESLTGVAPKGNRAHESCASVDPLYLFACGVSWHRHRDATAGWELIQSLRSQDKGSRAIAAALLARTEHARLLVRDLRRARVRVSKPAVRDEVQPVEQRPSKVDEMNTPYGLEIVESCLTCKLRKDHWFCGWDPLESTCRHASLSIL